MKHLSIIAFVALNACSSSIGPVVPETQVERKMIGLLQKFDRWDDDGNGQLDRNELTEGLRGSGHSPDAVIEFYDINRNGNISLKEAQIAYGRAPEADARVKSRAKGNP
ncbi:MAG: EF-hand domain-containing protein [Luteolibacter sp.]